MARQLYCAAASGKSGLRGALRGSPAPKDGVSEVVAVRPEELANALIEIARSSTWITVRDTGEKRLTFEDDRAWSFFAAALDPWNDFTYVWLRNILEPLADHLAEYGTLDDFDLHKHVDASVDVSIGGR